MLTSHTLITIYEMTQASPLMLLGLIMIAVWLLC